MSDQISNMFSMIKNAYRARKESVIIPHSNLKAEIARALKERGFVKDIEKKGKKVKKFLELVLSYKDGSPSLLGLERVSKSSRRMYASKNELKIIRRGRGTFIISTSKGVMTREEALKAGLGGEIIAKVW